jgi:hypothetical protein
MKFSKWFKVKINIAGRFKITEDIEQAFNYIFEKILLRLGIGLMALDR